MGVARNGLTACPGVVLAAVEPPPNKDPPAGLENKPPVAGGAAAVANGLFRGVAAVVAADVAKGEATAVLDEPNKPPPMEGCVVAELEPKSPPPEENDEVGLVRKGFETADEVLPNRPPVEAVVVGLLLKRPPPPPVEDANGLLAAEVLLPNEPPLPGLLLPNSEVEEDELPNNPPEEGADGPPVENKFVEGVAKGLAPAGVAVALPVTED